MGLPKSKSSTKSATASRIDREIEQYLSFDDVLLRPGLSSVLPSDVSTGSQLGPFSLSIPLLSAAMDTVTESEMAIALSLRGGLGVVHKNLSIEDQVSEVKKVKNFQHAIIRNPLTVKPEDNLDDVKAIVSESGISGFPVIQADGKLVGILTERDFRYAPPKLKKVKDVMTSDVFSLKEGSSKEDSLEFFRKYKVEKLPLVDKKGILTGLITSKDWRKTESFPQAQRDTLGSLRVAAAIGAGDEGLARAKALIEAGADCLVLDSAHGHSQGILETLKKATKLGDVSFIAGNVGTSEGAEALIKAGADIVKIGIGPGSICTTRIVSGVGVPQFSAVYEICSSLRKKYPKVGFVADGGIRYSGDMVKALAAGAHAVMLGSLLAGTSESPGEQILYRGRAYKKYRGMGSLPAMKKGSKDRYGQAGVEASKLVPEGVEARVAFKGSVNDVIYQLLGGLRSGMGYVGAKDLNELAEKARFVRITANGLRESHVHDVQITAEAPNYSSVSEGEGT
ncbi:MAG: IMP dehydrogenase [Bdellovibrionota bacterium]